MALFNNMANIPSDKLQHLVGALTPTEKRYLRLYMGTRSERDNKYQMLFDLISENPGISDSELMQAFYTGGQADASKFAELKNYLYNTILKALKQFDEGEITEYRVGFFLESIQVLYKRGLYRDCRRLLTKAKRLSEQYELFTHQLQVIRWEKQLAYTQMDVEFLHRHLESLQIGEEYLLRQLQNEAEYRQMFFKVYTIVKHEAQLNSDERIAQLRKLLDQDTFREVDNALSHRARILHYRIWNLYHFAAVEYDKFYETGQYLLNLLESKPHFLRQNRSDLIAALSNNILAAGLKRRYDEVQTNLMKLRKTEPLTYDDRQKIHRQYYSNMFVFCIFSGDFQRGKLEIADFLEKSSQFDPDGALSASFYFQFCCVSFGNADYDTALHYLNAWLNQPRTIAREDLQSVARILALIIHYEMGNDILLDSLLRAATRFLKKKNRLFQLERRFIHLMNTLKRAHSEVERQEAYTIFKAELKNLALKPAARSLLQTFDLEAWLESKIRNVAFSAIVQEKFRLQTTGKSNG